MQADPAMGVFLIARRQELRITAAELARRSGLNKSTILRLERGQITRPSAEVCERLAHALQLPAATVGLWAGHRLPPLCEYLRATYGPLPDDLLAAIQAQLQAACDRRQ